MMLHYFCINDTYNSLDLNNLDNSINTCTEMSKYLFTHRLPPIQIKNTHKRI